MLKSRSFGNYFIEKISNFALWRNDKTHSSFATCLHKERLQTEAASKKG